MRVSRIAFFIICFLVNPWNPLIMRKNIFLAPLYFFSQSAFMQKKCLFSVYLCSILYFYTYIKALKTSHFYEVIHFINDTIIVFCLYLLPYHNAWSYIIILLPCHNAWSYYIILLYHSIILSYYHVIISYPIILFYYLILLLRYDVNL